LRSRLRDGSDIVTEILPFLKDQLVFNPEATHAMSVAFDEICRALFVNDGAKAVREAVADKVIEHARSGENDSDRLRDAVLKEIGAGGRLPSSRRQSAAPRGDAKGAEPGRREGSHPPGS